MEKNKHNAKDKIIENKTDKHHKKTTILTHPIWETATTLASKREDGKHTGRKKGWRGQYYHSLTEL